MIKINYFLLLLNSAISFSVKADLRPVYLSLEISAPKTKFTTTELVQINVTLKNGTSNRHSILIPGNQSKGLKLIYSHPDIKYNLFAEWKSSNVYHIKCKDKYENEPSPNECSMIVSAVELAKQK